MDKENVAVVSSTLSSPASPAASKRHEYVQTRQPRGAYSSSLQAAAFTVYSDRHHSSNEESNAGVASPVKSLRGGGVSNNYGSTNGSTSTTNSSSKKSLLAISSSGKPPIIPSSPKSPLRSPARSRGILTPVKQLHNQQQQQQHAPSPSSSLKSSFSSTTTPSTRSSSSTGSLTRVTKHLVHHQQVVRVDQQAASAEVESLCRGVVKNAFVLAFRKIIMDGIQEPLSTEIQTPGGQDAHSSSSQQKSEQDQEEQEKLQHRKEVEQIRFDPSQSFAKLRALTSLIDIEGNYGDLSGMASTLESLRGHFDEMERGINVMMDEHKQTQARVTHWQQTARLAEERCLDLQEQLDSRDMLVESLQEQLMCALESSENCELNSLA